MPPKSRGGAVRKTGSKKGAVVGTGGHGRRALQGKGPTPKAEDREYHKAHKAKAERDKRQQTQRRKKKEAGDVVAGRNSVVEALREGVPATALYVAHRVESDDRVKESIALAADRGIALLEAGRQDLDRLTNEAIHQGIALQVKPYEYSDPADLIAAARNAGEKLLVSALDGVTDPRNLGAIVRTTAAFGGHGVIVPERRAAQMTATAWKTSAGAAARLPVARVKNLTRALEELKQAGVFVLGLDMEGDVQLPELELGTESVVVVVGSEGKGLSRIVRAACDQVVSIPMAAASESLNAGIAASVALYEISRSRA